MRTIARSTVVGSAVAVVVLLLAGPLAAPASAAPDAADAVVVHEDDVFVIVGSTLRHPSESTDPGAPLLNVAGVGLGVTWGEWSAADATSTMRTAGRRTDVRLALSGLRPGGVYSVFYGTLGPDSENPRCPGVERTLPVPAFPHADGPPADSPHADSPDASSFIAGGDGSASYRGRVDAVLADALQVFVTVVYHFDGQTYGDLPNRGEYLTQGESCRSSFGEDAMRHLIVLQKW